MKTLCFTTLALSFLLTASSLGQAQIITTAATAAAGNVTANTSPGDGNDYQFFGVNLNNSILNSSNYADIAGANNDIAIAASSGADEFGFPSSDTTLTGPNGGSSFETGILFNHSNPGNLLTFQLTPNSTETDFDVFVLVQNYSINGDNAVTLSLQGGTLLQTATQIPTTVAASGAANDFVVFHVTGATTSDVFQVGVTSADGGDYVGGISFANTAVATPEPATYALLGFGVAVLLFRRRLSSSL